MECENTYNPSFSRVRVRAYIQEFLFFCCHKCHRFLCKQLETRLLSYPFECFLTVCQCIPSKSQCRTLEKRDFPSSFLLHSPPYFPHLSFRTSPPCDTCDSKKTQLRLERARENLHGFLFCTFKIEVQKKGRSPRTIRNYLVILLGNAGGFA